MAFPSVPPARRAVLAAALALGAAANAQHDQHDATAHTAQRAPAPFTRAQQRGLDFLLAHQQDGTFRQQDEPHVGVTALALSAALTKPAGARTAAERTFLAAATSWLLGKQNEDGSFGESIPNYQTSAAVMALGKLDTPAAKAAVEKAAVFLLAVQNSESSESSPEDKDYGGFGYGPGQRGDLSNTQFAIEALRASGLPADHEAFQRAIRFLQRVQNLRSVNDFKTEASEQGSDETFPVEPGNDGGAAYLPGNSKFGFDVLADGVHVPRSYGSMTYALLKTYALCGLPKDDERMRAASEWIRKHWVLDHNPGNHAGLDENAKYQGLFYYYETMARALTICGVETIAAEGENARAVSWRHELAEHLAATQREDGSWVNGKNGRWWEDQAVMCTIYALLALADCHGAPHRASGS